MGLKHVLQVFCDGLQGHRDICKEQRGERGRKLRVELNKLRVCEGLREGKLKECETGMEITRPLFGSSRPRVLDNAYQGAEWNRLTGAPRRPRRVCVERGEEWKARESGLDAAVAACNATEAVRLLAVTADK